MPDLDRGHTGLIIRVAREAGLLRNQLAYVLATAWHETNRTMEPVEEAYWLSERWRRENLRYWPWHGRGFVQLTWERNYLRAGKELDIDLTTDPDAAMEPEVAARILVAGMVNGWFTGKKISDYITLDHSYFTHARQIVNGMDDASDIAAIAREYDAQLKALGYGEEAAPEPRKPAPATPDPSERPAGLWASLMAALRSIFGKA